MNDDLKKHIRDIPDFPKAGILFRDITPLLANAGAFHQTVDRIAEPFRGRIDMVLGIESRGFIVGSPVAYVLNTGLAVVRKPGKLPSLTFTAQYALEYGHDALEIHRDAFGYPCRVLMVDDLLATGGTARAAVELVERLGGEIVACAFIIELDALKGRDALRPHQVFSLIKYTD